MKIDRHNYEEFFLLYVDNELTAEQKQRVQLFIRENPDLGRELELLQQVTLQTDDAIVFEGKEMLLRREGDSPVNMTNYEEYLIAYIDNELTDAERIEFFKFAAAHPQVKEELDIYQQTKLQPEKELVFGNKEVLYRREEKVRVVSIQWWKIAVAASIILAIGITTITVMNKPATVVPAVAGNTGKPAEKINPTTTPAKPVQGLENSPVEIKDNNGDVASASNPANTERNRAGKIKTTEKTTKQVIQPVITRMNDELVAKKDIPAKNSAVDIIQSKEVKSIELAKKSDDPVAIKDVAVNTNMSKEISDNNVTNNPEVSSLIQTEPIDPESYNEGKNKKTRGFFRKAARVFERRTNISASDEDNNDKVLIGALAVKLK